MAVTRINNNQISDASAGNAYVGINAAVKLQNYTVTATKLANNLTYGSDLTVTGNLTVQGNTTTIDTTYTTIEDPIILLASNQTGAPAVDIGFVGQRGTSNNIAFVWDESAGEFITAFTTTGESNTIISIASYANLHVSNANIDGNMVVNGTTSFVGNILGNVSLAGNVTLGNVLTNGQVSAAGNVTGGNINTGGIVTATGNIISAANINGANINATTGVTATTVIASANITGGNILTGGIVSSTGNITSAANVAGGNVLTNGQVSSTGNITSAANITGGNLLATTTVSAVSFIGTTASLSANIVGGNLLTGGLVSATGNIISAANVSGGNVLSSALIQGVTVSATGNVIGGNVTTTGQVSATGNVTSAANVAGGNVVATATVSGASVLGSIVSASGNVTGGNILTGGLVSATGNIISAANVSGGNLVATTAVVTPTVVGTTVTISSTGGLITLAPSSNVSVNNKYINNLAQPVQDNDAASKIYVDNLVSTALTYHQAVTAATTGTLETATGGTITYAQPNGAGNGVGATLTVAGGTFNLIDTANIQTANTRVLVKNQANAVLNGVYVWSNATVLTRAVDADEYGPASAEQLSVNDYFFVQGGNVNAGSAWVVDAPSGTITFGTSNIAFAQFSSSQTYTANTSAGIVITGTVISAKVDNDTTAFDGTGNIIVKAGANLTTPNIGAATGTSLSVTGNLTGAGANISGNVSGGNLLTSGLISASANITGGNILTGGQVSSTGNISSSANISGGNLLTGGQVSSTGNITSAANVAGGNVVATTLVQGTTLSATGNVIGGNITTGGQVSATGNITSAANVAGGNLIATAIVSGASVLGTIVSASANITGGNILTGGLINATGNITSAANVAGGNVVSSANVVAVGVVASGNVLGGNLLTGGLISATGNISSSANISGANVLGTNVSASGNITGANINTGGTNSLTLNASTINSNAARITINSNGSDVDFAVDSDATANVFYIDAGTGTASFGTSTQTTNAIVAFNASNSILMPVGNTGQRPGTGVTGMIRFNSTLNAVEVYDNSAWSTVGTPSFTIIADEQFTGNGVQTVFTLSSSSYTTNSVIVSINGVVQIPTSAYSVSGTSLTFTEAPQTGDFIDVRELTTTTQVTSISNSPGNAVVAVNPTINEVSITGNLVPVANNTQSLGTQTLRWKDAYIGGNSLYLGNIIMKNTTGNIVAFYGPDGTTPATIDSTNVDTTTITNGTSSVAVIASGGNIRANVGGSAIITITSGGIINNMGNGVGNIGNATGYFNTVFAKATSAQYADLAEVYAADAKYQPGTVVSFGGAKEVTLSSAANDARIAGVVSTNPSYVMNATLESEHTVTVALTGRVPTLVSGPVAKGDMMVSGGNGRAVACATPAIGTVIGKALENHSGGDGTIEVVVGRL